MDSSCKISGSHQEQITNSKHFTIWWVFRGQQEWLSCLILEEQGVYYTNSGNVWLFCWPTEKKRTRTQHITQIFLPFFFDVLAQITFNFEITFPFITFVSSSPFSNTHTLTFQSFKTLNEKFSTWLYVPSSLHSGINTCWNSLRACSWVYFLSATHLETSREREKISQLEDATWRKDRWSSLLWKKQQLWDSMQRVMEF